MKHHEPIFETGLGRCIFFRHLNAFIYERIIKQKQLWDTGSGHGVSRRVGFCVPLFSKTGHSSRPCGPGCRKRAAVPDPVAHYETENSTLCPTPEPANPALWLIFYIRKTQLPPTMTEVDVLSYTDIHINFYLSV